MLVGSFCMSHRRAPAMLDCQEGEKDGDNCTHCHTSSGDNRLYWGIQLDQDLLETIVSIYPEWFKDCNMNLEVPGDVPDPEPSTVVSLVHESENNSEVEDAISFQKTFRRNKESLRSPTAFHEQRKKLEQAKMGDLFKNKIQKRPDKQSSVQQHILEDSNVDPSMQEKQRQLKKARLVNGLKNQILQRPGPLELVKGNILEADEFLAQAVKEGSIPFRNTCEVPSPMSNISQDDESHSEGSSPSPPYCFSEHSQGSFPSLETSEPSPVANNHGSPCSVRTSFSMSPPSSVCSPLSVMPSVVSPLSHTEQVPDLIVNGLLLHSKEIPMRNRKKAKPKAQPKARTIKFHEYKGPPNAQKNTNPSSSNSSNSSESSYDLLLQQQQLFLQWQLEWQQKYPQSVMPSTQLLNGDQSAQTNQNGSVTNQNQLLDSPTSPQRVIMKLEDLKVSDLKAELKKRNLPVSGPKPVLIERLKSFAESSHSKTASSSDVPFCSKISIASKNRTNSESVSVGGHILDNLSTIPAQNDIDMDPVPMPDVLKTEMPSDEVSELLDSLEQHSNQPNGTPSALAMDLDSAVAPEDSNLLNNMSETSSSAITNEDIVQLQQRCIEKLQRELQKSQLQLQQTIIGQQLDIPNVPEENNINGHDSNTLLTVPDTSLNSSPPPIPAPITVNQTVCPSETTSMQADAETKIRQRQLIHQQLQQKIQQQSLQMQQQKLKKEHNQMKSSAKVTTNSTLTALLESQPVDPQIDITVPSLPESMDTSKSFPSTVMSTQVDEGAFDGAEDSFPGVSFFPYTRTMDLSEPSVETVQVSPQALTNGINKSSAHRTSSLPSFSALINKKAPPARSNTDSQFILAKPPPDYDEATRQLSKIKQQFLQTNYYNSSPTQLLKKQKSSVKCQAVDDVLEILIKNGELPPSAAQEPPALSTTVPSTREMTPPSLFYTTTTAADGSSAITIPTNVVTSPVASTSLISSSCESDNSASLHITSLQSVLDMTPPSSAGFGETNINTPSSLDFDFHLDVEDIEVMELDGLSSHQSCISSRLELPLVEHLTKETRRHSEPSHISSTMHNTNQLPSDLMDFQGKTMDGDVMDWLGLLGDNSGVSMNSSSSFHHQTFSVGNDHDPLLSNMIDNHDSLELFNTDDMDFKPNEGSILSWDKVDFAT